MNIIHEFTVMENRLTDKNEMNLICGKSTE